MQGSNRRIGAPRQWSQPLWSNAAGGLTHRALLRSEFCIIPFGLCSSPRRDRGQCPGRTLECTRAIVPLRIQGGDEQWVDFWRRR